MAEPTRPPAKPPHPPASPASPATTKARVHCERCDKESDVELVAGQTNTGKPYLHGACPHCGGPVYALPG